MSTIATPAIVIRRLDYGDYDRIVTLLTCKNGRQTVIAKSARRSKKRFGGILELFYIVEAVVKTGGRGLPMLMEASLIRSMFNIAADIRKTAYASYWAELVYMGSEEQVPQEALYQLLAYCLTALDTGDVSAERLSILFQMRYLDLAGLCPNLERCSGCAADACSGRGFTVNVDLKKGGIVCEKCASYSADAGTPGLAKGTLKQLQWLTRADVRTALRVRFTAGAIRECLSFLEAFVCYHMGKDPRSLQFLRQIRRK